MDFYPLFVGSFVLVILVFLVILVCGFFNPCIPYHVFSGDSFCRHCGVQLIEPKPVCPECHATLPYNSSFCPDCGSLLDSDVSVEED